MDLKSLTARASWGCCRATAVRVDKGEIVFGGEDITKVSYERLRGLRGGEISMIFKNR